eukprot:CAMPEP_0185856994 /NCGR_PEP_ID=MMETSP1354-20130828/29276_1 /TAXON_ID=708628 /ORGANISM="Erythrolobus madagascarensis, Strain CCMP3276" /LENGTH=313 /DNA_ID=CAMNT_0028559257 /DNA_START=167 /DNA_END=1108 /DNA_ORIENTATION=+
MAFGFSTGVTVGHKKPVAAISRANASQVVASKRNARVSMAVDPSGATNIPALIAASAAFPALFFAGYASGNMGVMQTPTQFGINNLDEASFRRFSKSRSVGQFMADFVMAKHKAMSMPNGLYNPQCVEGTAKGEAFMKRHQFMSRVQRNKQRTPYEKVHDVFTNRKLAAINLGHICNAEEEDFYRFPELATTYLMTKMELDMSCNRYAVPESEAEKYLMKSVNMQMEKRATPYGIATNLCCDGRFKGDAEARRVAAGTVAFRARQMSPAMKARQRYNSKKHALVNGHPCQYEEEMFTKFPASAASMSADMYRF